MEITKYNRGNGKFTIGSQASINANNKNNSSSTTTTTSGSDCELWGNHFDGTTDIEDTIFVNGSVYAMPDRYNVDDEDDSDLPEGELESYESREFEKFEDDNGGNIYAQNLIKSFGDIKAVNDIEGSSTYGKTVYLDYPERKSDDSNKTDLLPLLKDFDGRISTNTTNIASNKSEIDSLKSRVSTAETKITNIDSRVTNNEGDITNLYEAIENLESELQGEIPTKVSQLENDKGYITLNDLPESDKNAPVVLFSGSIHSNNNDTSLTYQPWAVRPNLYSQHTGVEKIEMDYYKVNGEKKPSLVVNVIAKEGWTVKPTSVSSSVTLNVHWNPTVDFGGNRRSQGYWTTGGVYVDGNIYIQVWRTGDDNNDTTTNDCIAWQVQEMNLTIFGIAYKTA